MCICCCLSRRSLLIYAIVVNSIEFIFGILAIANFGSNTDVYDIIRSLLELYDDAKNGRTLSDYSTLNENDLKSVYNLITEADLDSYPYNLVLMLKGMEKGLGTILFVFSIIFLVAEIVYMVFICGVSENQVLKVGIFHVLRVLKVITYTFSIIFIFLSFFYGVMLFAIFIIYIGLVDNTDSCSRRIFLQYAYGYFSFWIYITLACIFGRERQLFLAVGSEANPGLRAEYNISGVPIVRTVVTPQIIGVGPQMVVQPAIFPYQQVQVYNQQMMPNQMIQQNPNQAHQQTPNQINPSSMEKPEQNQNSNSARCIKN